MSVTAPQGFVAAGGPVGIKAADAPDLAVVATDDGRPVPAAGVFTANLATAAPVQVSRAHLAATTGQAAAVVLTSGNANAATGQPGMAAARRLCELVANSVGSAAEEVLVCQTGLIGVPFPLGVVEPLVGGVVAGRAGGDAAGRAAAEAIMTTDTVRKEAVARGPAGGGSFTVGGMAKGAAMLAPNMATMLAVLTTDAAAEPAVLQEILRAAVVPTFNSMSVDGCASTNDTVLFLSSGRAGPVDRDVLAGAVTDVCGALAGQMVADAEGATKVVHLQVTGAATDGEAHRAARKVADSLLVKCSLNGEDPYWGRGRQRARLRRRRLRPRPRHDRLRRHRRLRRRRRGRPRHDRGGRPHGRPAYPDRLRPRARRRGRCRALDRPRLRLHRREPDDVVTGRNGSNSSATAALLVEALPYIRRFAGKIVVVKYGGNALAGGDEATALASLAEDVVLLRSVGLLPVVVHGGGPQIGELLRRLGKETEFRDGLRVTDADTLDVARMVLVGKVNRDIVSAINVHGPLAVGLSGEDANLITAGQRAVELGYVGDVVGVDPTILERLLAEGLIPVLATIGADTDGQAYNINADTVAGAVAEALGAEKLVFLTDIEGLRADPDNPQTFVRQATAAVLDQLVETGGVVGGMVPKVEACARAVRGGVAQAHILDGRVAHALLLELFTDRGVGTMVIP